MDQDLLQNILGLANLERRGGPPQDAVMAPGTQNANGEAAVSGLSSLPNEILLNIIELVNNDPVTQMNFALTCRKTYNLYHAVKDRTLPNGDVFYPIKSWPLDLRLQISDDNLHMWHGWFPWLDLESDTDIVWGEPLGDLLSRENMFNDLRYCNNCAKYKPKPAFTESEYEKQLEEKGTESLEEILQDTEGHCTRCRVKVLLVKGEDRVEWFEDEIVEEYRTSLGLREVGWERLVEQESVLKDKMTSVEFLEHVGGFETWTEVFEQIGI